MKTENEAKKLLCPNKLDFDDEKDRFCEASGCMMWEWSKERKRNEELKGDCALKFCLIK